MRFLSISKIMLVLIVPFLIFLAAASSIAFDKSYYAGKLSEYGANIPGANSLNEKTINFVSGKGNELPDVYNERERQHLADVKDIVKKLRISLYFLMGTFISLFLVSSLIAGINDTLANFAGIVFTYGGFLTIGLAAVLLILINLNFPPAFDFFHRLFFQQGTYTFDSANEVIVRLYPEEFFMDAGLRISKWVLFVSAISIIAGTFLIFTSKSKKNKNKTN